MIEVEVTRLDGRRVGLAEADNEEAAVYAADVLVEDDLATIAPYHEKHVLIFRDGDGRTLVRKETR